MHPRMPLAFLAARAHCWLMVNLSSTSTPRSLSTELLSSRSTPSLYWCMGLFLPRCRTLHLPLLNFIRFLSAQLSSLSRSHWMAAQAAGVSTTPPSFVSSRFWMWSLWLNWASYKSGAISRDTNTAGCTSSGGRGAEAGHGGCDTQRGKLEREASNKPRVQCRRAAKEGSNGEGLTRLTASSEMQIRLIV